MSDDVETHDHPAGVVPGGGWMASWSPSDGGRITSPVVGWLVDEEGWGTALLATGDGIVSPADGTWRDLHVFHPDELDEGGSPDAA